MADLTLANSGYSSGSIDTASTLVNNVSATDAQHINGPNSAAVQIQGILGVGTDLRGTAADLVARLTVEHNADGTQRTLIVGRGGTGQTSFTLGAIPLGNGTSGLFASAGIAEQVPFFQGSATASWTSGLAYQGPAQTGPSSTLVHGETNTISANQNLSGVNLYTNLTINAGVTVTVPANGHSVIIMASNAITVNGTITGVGGGGAGGTGSTGNGSAGTGGTEQAGAGGGGGTSGTGGTGGAALCHGITMQSGGAGGGTGAAGTAATARTGATSIRTLLSLAVLGGAGGGGGGGDGGGQSGGAGGAGGGSIVLIAPTITLGSAATLRADGTNGTGGAASGGGGGGGSAGSIYLVCRTLVDNGATFSTGAGSGGAGGAGGGNGGTGATGVQQRIYYGV